MLKTKKAITLIALIITIIILLILAGVTINMVVGENGLFNKAKTSVAKYENAQEKENTALVGYEDEMNSYINNDRNLSITDEQYKIQHTMSGTEHFTGEYYIDGKPIYEKTIYIDGLPNNSYSTYNHGISNVDIIWNNPSNSILIWPNGVTASFQYVYGTNTSSSIGVSDIDKTSFRISAGLDRSLVKAYITLNYTKTTDTATITTPIPPTPANI